MDLININNEEIPTYQTESVAIEEIWANRIQRKIAQQNKSIEDDLGELIGYEKIENEMVRLINKTSDYDLNESNHFKKILKDEVKYLTIVYKYALLDKSLQLCQEQKKHNLLEIVNKRIEKDLKDTPYYDLFK